MKLSAVLLIVALSAACALGCTIILKLRLPRPRTSKFAIATFIENNINFGTNGGLYAELIRNGAF